MDTSTLLSRLQFAFTISLTNLSVGNILFTLIGFAGMYVLLGLLYVVLIVYEALRGPGVEEGQPQEEVIPQVAQGLGD